MSWSLQVRIDARRTRGLCLRKMLVQEAIDCAVERKSRRRAMQRAGAERGYAGYAGTRRAGSWNGSEWRGMIGLTVAPTLVSGWV